MLSIIGILVGLTLLIVLALKDWNVILVALISSIVVIVFSGMPIFQTLNDVYLVGFGSWGSQIYLMLLSASVLAKLMEDTGAAQSISNTIMKWAGEDNITKIFIGIWLVTSILVYAGVNSWIIVYVLVPIVYPIFKKLDLPWHLALAIFVLGANCIANYLPGAVSVYNIMPTKYRGTTPLAGWKISLFSDTFSTALGFWYVFRQLKKARANNEHFLKPTSLVISDTEIENVPGFGKAIAPLIVTLVTLNVFKLDVFFALSLGCITCIILMYKNMDNVVNSLSLGASSAMMPVVTTSAVVGFGKVVTAVPGFEIIADAIINGIPGGAYASWCVSINLLAGVTGSASGGLGIALESILPRFMGLGLNPEALHRLAALSTVGLDSLPHNVAVVTTLTIFGLSHKEAYKHFWWITVVFTVLSCVPAVIAAMIFY